MLSFLWYARTRDIANGRERKFLSTDVFLRNENSGSLRVTGLVGGLLGWYQIASYGSAIFKTIYRHTARNLTSIPKVARSAFLL